MAAINVSRASQTLTSASFMTSAVLVVVGALLAQRLIEPPIPLRDHRRMDQVEH